MADTGSGLTGSEMGRILSQQNIPDPEPMITKRHRLFTALHSKQNSDRCANNVLAFIQAVMDPVRYVGSPLVFVQRRVELNTVLVLRGYEIKENGKISCVDHVHTLTEAQRKARNLH